MNKVQTVRSMKVLTVREPKKKKGYKTSRLKSAIKSFLKRPEHKHSTLLIASYKKGVFYLRCICGRELFTSANVVTCGSTCSTGCGRRWEGVPFTCKYVLTRY